MTAEAHLMLGPLDGEVLMVAEALSTLNVMAAPPRILLEKGYAPPPEMTHHIYVREQKERKPGVFYYHHVDVQTDE